MPTLTIKSGGTEERVPVQSPKVVVGRGVESDVKLKDIKVSKQHFAIMRTQTGYTIQDLSSGTGTLLNGQPVQAAHALKAGDVIKVGDTQIVFASDGQTVKAGAVGAKPTTQRMPSASTAKPSKPGAPPTGVQTRPTTRAMQPVAKAGSGSTQKASAITQKTSSRMAAVKPATGRLKPPTQRKPLDRKEAIKSKRLGSLHRDMRGGKKSKVPLLIGLGVVVVGIIVAVIMGGGGGGEGKGLVKGMEALVTEGYALLQQNDYATAKEKFERAISIGEGAGKAGDAMMTQAKAGLKQIADAEAAVETVRKKWIDIKADLMRGQYDFDDMLKRLGELRDQIKDSKVDFKDEVQRSYEVVENELKTYQATVKMQALPAYENEKVKPLTDEKQWGKAIAMWEKFIEGKTSDLAEKARTKINQINVRANTEWANDLKKEVGRAFRDKGAKAATDLLEKEMPRFEGTLPYKDEKGMKALYDWIKAGKNPDDFFK